MSGKENRDRMTRHPEEGAVLIVTLIMCMVLAGVLAALTVSTVSRAQVAEQSNLELERVYAAQAGIERMKVAIMSNTGGGVNYPDEITSAYGSNDPVHTFDVGIYTIETFLEDLGTNPADPWLTWYLIRSRATDTAGNVSEIGVTTQLVDSFGKYVVFVDEDLNIGDFARYAGDVHANEDIGINGHHVTFLGNVTAHGRITFGNSNAKNTCTFAKNAVPGVPVIPRPTVEDIEKMRENPPEGAYVYDWQNDEFIQRFKDKTGKTPNDTLVSYIEFQQDEMNVVHYCQYSGAWVKMEETVPVPNNRIIYSAGDVHAVGHLSRRTSIFTPRKVVFDGPLRYVDDNDEPQYIVYDKNDGVANFDETLDMWKPVVNWKEGNKDYREADDWIDRRPVVDGLPQNPVLGVVAGSTIYIDNADKDFPKNAEIHAMLYSADDRERPTDTSDPNGHNLVILGGRVQVASSPNSGAWHFRHYLYDENLRACPPPGFPTLINPKFTNWHVR